MTLLANSFRAITKVNTARPPVQNRFATLGTTMLGAHRRSSSLDMMDQSSWLFAVIDRIASAVSANEWQLYRKVRNGPAEEVLEHPLLDLWENPNPFYTRDELVELADQHLELSGEVWWVLVRSSIRGGEPVELWPVRPDRMTPVPDRQSFIRGYVYTLGGERIPLDVEDVIFIRRPSPSDPYRGIGVVGALLPDILGDRSAAEWNNNMFKNSAQPGGVIELEDEMPDDEYDKFVQRWQQQHQGVSNVGRVAVLERAKWVDRQMSHQDLQWGELRKLSRDSILGAFGVPKSVLGITEDVNRANAEAGEAQFARWVIVPRLQRLKVALNTQLAPLFGDDLFFDFSDPVPANSALDLDRAERGFRGSILTRNEARMLLEHDEIEEMAGGEEFAGLPFGSQDAQEAIRLYGANLETMNEARERVDRPPHTNGDLTVNEARAAQLSATIPAERMLKASDPLLPEPVEIAESDMRDAWEERLSAEVRGLVSHLEQTKGFLPRWKIEHGDIEGYDWNWTPRYLDAVIAELLKIFRIGAVAAEPALPVGMAHAFAVQYAEVRAAELIKGVSETTRKRVRELVAQSIESGESLQTIEKTLRDDYVFSRDRARMIARTETATSLGEGAQRAALAQGRDEKRWDTQSDPNVDSLCLSNEAQGWLKISEPFQSGHDKIPAHPGCRCVTRYRTAELAEPGVLDGVDEDVAGAVAESRSVHCPQCERRLPVNNLKGTAEVYCKRCNESFEVNHATGEALSSV